MEKERECIQSWISNNKKIAFWGASVLSQSLILDILKQYTIKPVCIFDNYCKETIVNIGGMDIPVKKFDETMFSVSDVVLSNDDGIRIILCINSRESYRTVCNCIKNAGYEENKNYVDGYTIGIAGIFGTREEPYEEIRPSASYAPWRKDDAFNVVYTAIKNNTLVDIYRCFSLWELIKQTSKCAEGDLIEIGVWKGGSGALIAERVKMLAMNVTVYLCDTFTGVVKTSERDSYYKGGEHADTSIRIVQQLMDKLVLDNVNIVQGIFPEEVKDIFINKRYRFVHIDVDAYRSAKEVFEYVWPDVVSGGIVVFDDYGFPTTSGVTMLVEELMVEKSNGICINTLNGQAIFIKK